MDQVSGRDMNAFNALCKLASSEKWCWNLACTTCGHMHFRYAFVELASGKIPSDSEWIVHARRTKYLDDLGRLPRLYSEEQKRKILDICQKADLAVLASRCRFPDWLGYLGLVLAHMEIDDDCYKLLSMRWADQLRELVRPETPCWRRLGDVSEGRALLDLHDLESVEAARAFNLVVSSPTSK